MTMTLNKTIVAMTTEADEDEDEEEDDDEDAIMDVDEARAQRDDATNATDYVDNTVDREEEPDDNELDEETESDRTPPADVLANPNQLQHNQTKTKREKKERTTAGSSVNTAYKARKEKHNPPGLQVQA